MPSADGQRQPRRGRGERRPGVERELETHDSDDDHIGRQRARADAERGGAAPSIAYSIRKVAISRPRVAPRIFR